MSRVADKKTPAAKAKGKASSARGSGGGGGGGAKGTRKAGSKQPVDDTIQPDRIATHLWAHYPSDHRAAVDHL